MPRTTIGGLTLRLSGPARLRLVRLAGRLGIPPDRLAARLLAIVLESDSLLAAVLLLLGYQEHAANAQGD